MRLRALLFCLGLSLFYSEPSPAQQVCPPGKALVVGNSSYKNTAAIPSAVNDAHSIAEALRKLHFQVVEEHDAGIAKLYSTLQSFRANLQAADLAFFYYSGYAVQFQDDNYLLPVDYQPQNPDLDTQALAVSRVRALLSERSTGPKLLLLDTWRNADLAVQYPATELAPLASSPQTLIAFPVPSNEIAAGSAAQGGFFTRFLAQALETPGLSPVQVINNVTVGFSKDSSSKQMLMLNSLIVSECYMTGPPPESDEARLRKERDEAQRSLEREKEDMQTQLRKANELKPGAMRTNPKDNQDYVWIPPGTFQMGCVPEDTHCEEDENPRHAVTITRGFWMGQTEVQVANYRTYVNRSAKEKQKVAMPKAPQYNPHWSKTNLPIVNVTVDDALAFCQAAGGRLPTEAEWEYAARAGADGLIYPWGNSLTSKNASYAGVKGAAWDKDSMAPVKQFDPNNWGLYDMAGNAWEWCSDFYDPESYSHSQKENPPGPRQEHVKRGGSFNSAKEELRTSIRHRWHTYKWPPSDNNTGFRCVVEKMP